MKSIALIVAVLLVASHAVVAWNEIWINGASGGLGYINGYGTAEFVIRIADGSLPSNFWAYCNGFRLYSPDGAYWDTTYAEYLPEWLPYAQQVVFTLSADGSGTDTVMFIGQDTVGWFSSDYGADVWSISIEIPQDPANFDKTICIDTISHSLTDFPYSTWVWHTSAGAYTPLWNGPYCFKISCCNGDGITGNVDGHSGPGGEVDISDLTFLVDYLFAGGPSPCVEEANVEGCVSYEKGPIDVSDLTYIIHYLFQGGSAPPPCGWWKSSPSVQSPWQGQKSSWGGPMTPN
ncbi:MAG TPA: hypothetical protein VN285_04115 [Candidatus Deferrimicrobium sp.]|nr:hypothetical protein [Candidatus Deferrimicrobium sp.]